MEKIRIHFKDNIILYRMIAVFSMVSAIVVILLTTIMSSFFTSRMKNEMYQTQEKSLKQIADSVSFRAEYVNSLLLQVKEDEQISRLFFSSDISDAAACRKRLMELRGSVKHLSSIYIYDDAVDRIYNSDQFSFPFINNRSTFADKGFLEILDNIGDYPKYTPVLRKYSVILPSGRYFEDYVYTYLVYDTYSSGKTRNIVAFNFRLGWMEDALDFMSSDMSQSEKIWIIDNNRQIVYTSTGDMTGEMCDATVLSDAVYEQEIGYFFVGSGRDRKMVVHATPDRSGYDEWTFVSWYDYSTLVSPINQVRKTVYLICTIVFVLSLIAVFRLSHKLYQPVLTTINRVKVLEQENEKKRIIERRVFLRKLFLGDISTDDSNLLKIIFKRHQIEIDMFENLQIVLISVDCMKTFYAVYGKRLDEVDAIVESTILSQYQKLYPDVLCTKMHSGMWALCCPSKEKENDHNAVYENLRDFFREHMDISISMAVSPVGHSVRDIPYLYSEAVVVHSYRFLLGLNRMITYSQVQQQNQSEFEYPADIEKRLITHLFGGKLTEAMENYGEFSLWVKRFTVDEIRLAFMLLAYAIKGAAQKSVTETYGQLAEFNLFYKKLQTAETINQVDNLFFALFKDIADKLKKNSKDRYELLIEQIESYVEANYGDINLSMNQIADRVNMSAAYLGRLFKQVTGITFIEYLTKFRLTQACNLLRTTNLTVNEISDKVGFTNSSYFYIIFKKHLECTPNQYRKQYCMDEVDEG